MRYLTRPKDNLSVNEKKKIVKDHYKYEPWANKKVERLNTGGAVGAVPEAKPMPILDYISTVNRLYGNSGGSVEPDNDPKYIDRKEMEAIKKDEMGSVLVKDKDIEVWVDVWEEDGDYLTDWNKYIFFTNCEKDMEIKKYQENNDNYDEVSSVAIEYYINN